MTDSPQALISELFCFVEAGEHTTFKFIRNWPDYLFTCNVKRALKTLIDSLQYSADKLFKEYCKSIPTRTSDAHKLLVYKTLIKIIDFYKIEYQVTSDMLCEYEVYIMAGNFLDILFHTQRPERDLIDYREL